MRLTQIEDDVLTEVLAAPGIVIYDLLHRVKRRGHTYADTRQTIIKLIANRIIHWDDHNGSRCYFNRNGPVYRGIV